MQIRDTTSDWRRRLCRGFLLVLALTCAPATWAGAGRDEARPAAERRVALVIGNGGYRFSPLKNPTNDARAMAEALDTLGFEVTLREDASLRETMAAMRTFLAQGRDSDVRLFYYAGHGVQVKGRNYLIPTDAQILSEENVADESADLSALLERMGEFRKGLNILILDACRNNPFTNLTVASKDGRVLKFRGSISSGLAQVNAPQGSLVAFSTAPGSISMDGGNGSNGLYTKHLLNNIMEPGLPVEQLFKRVRMAVAQETKRMQIPWENSSLMGDFCFRTAGDQGCGGGAALTRVRARP